MEERKHTRWRGCGAVLLLAILTVTGCDKEPGPADAFMQRMAAYVDNPKPEEAKQLFNPYLSCMDGLPRTREPFRASALKEPYIMRMMQQGKDPQSAGIPAVIYGAMRGTAPANVIKSYLSAIGTSPWNPKNLREASTAAVEPWGWIARSSDGGEDVWFTLIKTEKPAPADIQLAAVSRTEKEARQNGADYATWREHQREQDAKIQKENDEMQAQREQADKLNAIKEKCLYNVRELYLNQVVFSDASLEMVEENDDLYAMVRFKVKNASSSPVSRLEFALIIYNDDGQPVVRNQYTIRDTLAPQMAYWRTIDLRSLHEVLAARSVRDENFTVELVPRTFAGGERPIPDDETIMAALQQDGNGWTYQGQPVSVEVSPRILEKYQPLPSLWEGEKISVQLKEIQEKARKEATELLAGVRVSGVVAPKLERNNVLFDITVTNTTDKTLDGLKLSLDFTEDGAIVDEETAVMRFKIAPGQSKTQRFGFSSAWLLRLHPALMSGKAEMKVSLTEGYLDGKRVDRDGKTFLPRVFR